MTEPEKLSVLIVDDHSLVRAGMRRLLETNRRVDIHEASSGEQALDLAQTIKFQIVLMDLTLPGINGLQATRQLLELDPDMAIIAVSGKFDGWRVRTLLEAGVRGYISKGCSAAETDTAISEILKGETYMTADVARNFATSAIDGESGNPFDKLSSRENQIVRLLLDGMRNRAIGERLHISEKTVSTHRARAFENLNVQSSSELMRKAIQYDLWTDA